MQLYILVLLGISLVILINVYLYNKLSSKNTINHNELIMDSLNNFDKRISTLMYFLNMAYNQVYQSDIAALTLSGYSLSEKENDVLCKKFINTVYSIMGSNILYYYVNMFGDEDAFLNNCLIYFNNELINKDLKLSMEHIAHTDNLKED